MFRVLPPTLVDRRHFPLTEPVNHRKCNCTIIRIFKLWQIQARAAIFLKDLLMEVKVIYLEDCKCLLRLVAEPWGILWSPGRDRRGQGSAWAGGWSSAGAWRCHPHTAEPLPPQGSGELQYKPVPCTAEPPPPPLHWGFYTLNPHSTGQRFVPLLQANLPSSASFRARKSTETFTGDFHRHHTDPKQSLQNSGSICSILIIQHFWAAKSGNSCG